MTGSLKNWGEKFRTWDRDFGWTYRTALFVLVLVALVAAPFWIFGESKAQPYAQSVAASSSLAPTSAGHADEDAFFAAERSNPNQKFATHTSAQHALYPFSVIPGGAHSKEELQRAITNDPVVAHHYADFDAARTSVIYLDHEAQMYVSYRVGSTVYWTSRPLTLQAGEAVLTDGKNMARTRCGNRLSPTPAVPISKSEPQSSAMDAAPDLTLDSLETPLEPPAFPPAFPMLPTAPGANITEVQSLPDKEILPTPLPVPYFPVVGGGIPGQPGGFPPTGPGVPIATPEPGSAVLLAIGAMLLMFLSWRIRHRNTKSS